jgi:hypothetical protein
METKRYMSCAETAKLVRAALKERHPGVKFSVRSDTYSNGASIRVRWTDGPTAEEVRSTTQLYTGATFDGMIDLKSYHSSILVDEAGDPELVSFGADFIFETRDLSDELKAKITAEYERQWGRPYDPNYHDGGCYASDRWYRIAQVTHA